MSTYDYSGIVDEPDVAQDLFEPKTRKSANPRQPLPEIIREKIGKALETGSVEAILVPHELGLKAPGNLVSRMRLYTKKTHDGAALRAKFSGTETGTRVAFKVTAAEPTDFSDVEVREDSEPIAVEVAEKPKRTRKRG